MKSGLMPVLIAVMILSLVPTAECGEGDPRNSNTSFTPKELGETLWLWCWAGEKGQHATFKKRGSRTIVTHLKDLSGKGNDMKGCGAYQVGIELPEKKKGGAYKTELPLIGLDSYTKGKGRPRFYNNSFKFSKPFGAEGPFYIVAVCMNTRKEGNRELWGYDSKNFVRFDQKKNRVTVMLAGQARQITAKNALPGGAMVFEIWRDKDNALFCHANGKSIGLPGVKMEGNFDLTGVGFDQSGSSFWDDNWMEFVMCKGVPSAEKREALRTHLCSKWSIPIKAAPSPKAGVGAE